MGAMWMSREEVERRVATEGEPLAEKVIAITAVTTVTIVTEGEPLAEKMAPRGRDCNRCNGCTRCRWQPL